jgi:hypothetical protein
LPMRDRVVARARELVETHQPTKLKKSTYEAIERVLADAESRVKNPDYKKAKKD